MKPIAITEQFLTIQGEGATVGRLAYFIRFAGCNLWCSWCDSMHSVDPKLFVGKTRDIDYSLIPQNCSLVVFTGGEPTLFDLDRVRTNVLADGKKRVFQVESNATLFPSRATLNIDNFDWNLSPKLTSSRQKTSAADINRLAALDEWSAYSATREGVIFKFVVCTPDDLSEIVGLVQKYSIQPERVYLMPEGRTQENQSASSIDWIVNACKENGFNLSPRLHVMLWGDRRGV